MRVVSVVRISVLLPSSKRRGRVLARLGGRAASSQGVGASHRHSVKLIQQPCQRAVRSKLAATYDCLEILKRKEKLCTADKEAQTFKAGENYHHVFVNIWVILCYLIGLVLSQNIYSMSV